MYHWWSNHTCNVNADGAIVNEKKTFVPKTFLTHGRAHSTIIDHFDVFEVIGRLTLMTESLVATCCVLENDVVVEREDGSRRMVCRKHGHNFTMQVDGNGGRDNLDPLFCLMRFKYSRFVRHSMLSGMPSDVSLLLNRKQVVNFDKAPKVCGMLSSWFEDRDSNSRFDNAPMVSGMLSSAFP